MSERGLPANIEASLSDDTVALAFLVYIDWPGGAGRFWTGVGPLEYDGHTWAGTGELGHIDKVADSLNKQDIGVELTLNYLDDDIRHEITVRDPVGRDASIYLALINSSTQVTEAYEIFPGFVDEIEILDSGESGAIKVRLASELARLSRPVWYQLSHAHQQYLFPGDKGVQVCFKNGRDDLLGPQPNNGPVRRERRDT